MYEMVNTVLQVNSPETANIPRMAWDEAVVAPGMSGVSPDYFALLIQVEIKFI
jgi:hypothetical protein